MVKTGGRYPLFSMRGNRGSMMCRCASNTGRGAGLSWSPLTSAIFPDKGVARHMVPPAPVPGRGAPPGNGRPLRQEAAYPFDRVVGVLPEEQVSPVGQPLQPRAGDALGQQ